MVVFLRVGPNSNPTNLLASLCHAHVVSSLAHTTQYTREKPLDMVLLDSWRCPLANKAFYVARAFDPTIRIRGLDHCNKHTTQIPWFQFQPQAHLRRSREEKDTRKLSLKLPCLWALVWPCYPCFIPNLSVAVWSERHWGY
jgi:hypothetical protein